MLTGIEMRGPDYRNFSAGGGKTLFRLASDSESPTRITVSESAIDAMSLAELAAEAGVRCDTRLPPDGLNDWNDTLRALTPNR